MTVTLAQALVAAQKEMPSVPKAARANYGNYATLDSIIDKTRGVLNMPGLAIAQFPSETQTGMPGLRTVLLHAESGEQIEATVPLLLNGKQDMQALGGAITYARRYGWAAVLGIANDEDDDGDRVSGVPVQQQEARVAQTQQPTATAPPADGEWRWPSGKHQGVTLTDTPLDYVSWYATNGPKPDVKQMCADFLGREPDDSEGIPF